MHTPSGAAALRQHFLQYFAARGHTQCKSAPLVPQGDPTLMFVNAGMVPFKDIFVGAEATAFNRAVSCQKCMRVSGKHNDLEEVGRTARHHTLFEMLGNFSFADYFKEEAITFAWDFVTRELGIDPARIYVTVFGGEGSMPADDESRALWRRISGLPDGRILGMGMADNFWQMGETGPCGPCTEIHVDQGGPTSVTPADFASGRVMEIWNNVFMQYQRHKDGKLAPLPAPSVDTGMGLERVAAYVQGQSSNYHSDLFAPLLETVAQRCGRPYQRSASEDDVSMRVIADHARATAFLVADGVQPSNEGRGYVMRRIMRRAIRHGRRLGLTDLFMPAVCATVVRHMHAAYPELQQSAELIDKVAQSEEEGFRRTLDTGLKLLENEVAQTRAAGAQQLSGAAAFRLYDTYGFPMDLTVVLAGEQGLQVDMAGFDAAMEAQKTRSRGAEVGDAAVRDVYKVLRRQLGAVEFVGDTHEDVAPADRPRPWRLHQASEQSFLETEVKVVALLQDGKQVHMLDAGAAAAEVVLSPTPLYGESGGQVGDAGMIHHDQALAQVDTTQKPVEGLTVSQIRLLRGQLRVGDSVWAGYDPLVRKQIRAHHSATHLLHGALRGVLGEHVKQAGSFVDAWHLRFDYAHFSAPDAAALRAVEDDANARVAAQAQVTIADMTYDEACSAGAIALFGEKYGERVRVISMGKSVELCGGTHVRNTAELDMLLIVSDQAIAAGVRRMEACVGAAARRRSRQTAALLQHIAQGLLQGSLPESPADAALSEAQPVLEIVARNLQLARSLPQGDAPAFAATDLGVTAPPLPSSFAYAQARAWRDVWQALRQLVQARPSEAEAWVQSCAEVDTTHVLRGVAALLEHVRRRERSQADAHKNQWTTQALALASQARPVGGTQLLCTEVDGGAAGALRDMADVLRQKLGSGVICLACAPSPNKVSLLVALTPDLQPKLRAGVLIRALAPHIAGRGGGKDELAQAGGTQPRGIAAAFAELTELVGAAHL